MENIHYLFRRLKAIDAGDNSSMVNFNYNFESFLSDWISDKTMDWDGILNQILNLIDKLIEEFDYANSYVFSKLSDFELENPNTQIFNFDSSSFPKRPKAPWDDTIIINEKEEEILNRSNQPDIQLNEIKKLKPLIEKCICEYTENNDSPLFNPKYKMVDRIPFNGNDQTLSVFINLLIKAGFILAKEAVPEDIISKSDRAIFKKEVLAKNELAKRLTEVFSCVAIEKSTNKLMIKYPKAKTLESKMQDHILGRMTATDVQRMQRSFTHILELMDDALIQSKSEKS